MERERQLSLFLGTELVTMFTSKVVQISQAKTYFLLAHAIMNLEVI